MNAPPVLRIELAAGQVVPWPPAPGGIAQVDELRRRRVRLVYRAATGRWRFPLVSASAIAELLSARPVLPIVNPFNRARRRQRRVYE